MRTRRRAFAFVLAGILATCGGPGSDRGTPILLDFKADGLADEMTDLEILVFEHPDADLCDAATMAAPAAWPATTDTPNQTLHPTYGVGSSIQLNPGSWGFAFRGGNAAFPMGTKDLARGCTIADLESGVNPGVNIEIDRVYWPGVCGDGTLDDDEMCDDSNESDGDDCSGDCLSTPVLTLNVTTESAQFDPVLLSAGSSGFVLAVTSDAIAMGADDGQHVRAQRLDTKGHAIAMGIYTDIQMNSVSTNQAQYQPSLALAGNKCTAVWMDINNAGTTAPPEVRIKTFDITTGYGTNEVFLNGGLAGQQAEPVVAGNGISTNQIAAWTNSRVSPQDVMCRRILDGVADPTIETTCSTDPVADQNQPAAAMSQDGTYAVAWTGVDAGGKGIWVRFWEADGTPITDDVAANTTVVGEQDKPALAWDANGRLLVVWRDTPPGSTAGVRARLFDTPGVADGADFVVSETFVTFSTTAAVPAVAAGGSVFIVAWTASGVGVVGRLVTDHALFGVNRLVASAGEPFIDDGEFPVTPTEYPNIKDVTIAVATPTEALVAWVDRSAGGTNDDIRGRIVPLD